MIKARANDLLILGLSHENLRRLKGGSPISVKLHELDLDLRLFIFAGETETQMHELMREFIGPGTHVHDHTKPSGQA